jgi:hypothetical protein
LTFALKPFATKSTMFLPRAWKAWSVGPKTVNGPVLRLRNRAEEV